jgi:hypothetical protein
VRQVAIGPANVEARAFQQRGNAAFERLRRAGAIGDVATSPGNLTP